MMTAKMIFVVMLIAVKVKADVSTKLEIKKWDITPHFFILSNYSILVNMTIESSVPASRLKLFPSETLSWAARVIN